MLEDDLRAIAHKHLLDPTTLDALLEIIRLQEGSTLAPGSPPAAPVAPLPERYTDLGLLGRGGMGEVREVMDHRLNRVVALKTIHEKYRETAGIQERFLSEASAAAQLEHPGVVPVHDVGWLPDGRAYFTMKVLRGRTLKEILRALHRDCEQAGWWVASGSWTLRRLVQALRQACSALDYAHSRGVIHRDIKPSNIMIGDFGEVMVMDWGLVRETAPGDAEAITIGHQTVFGRISGTPAYMAPEQARGGMVGPHTDIYGLGGVLYEILCARSPHAAVWAPAPAPGSLTGLPLPEGLVEICRRAMATDPDARHTDARALGLALQDWLDGVQARERGRQAVDSAEQLQPEADNLLDEAERLEAEAVALMEGVKPWAPESDKQPAWHIQDRAAGLRRKAALLKIDREVGLRAALSHDPMLPEAHVALARYHQSLQQAAEEVGDTDSALAAEIRLRGHLQALPRRDPSRSQIADWLVGDGWITLHTDPPAKVTAFRYVERGRRLHTERVGELGQTPLHQRLPRGSYLLHIEAPGHMLVRYPVFLGRQDHWGGCPPGADAPLAVPLPRLGAVPESACYIPPGWFYTGGMAPTGIQWPRRRLWCDGLLVERFPVTVAEYLEFLNDLVSRGEDALPWAPRERAGGDNREGALIFGQDSDGRFIRTPDADGDIWPLDFPMIMVDPPRVQAYCRWLAERTGQPWRLLAPMEWEKAARGVDRRLYPWGSFGDPSWMRSYHSAPRPFPVPVDSYPADVSPYGVRGMAGNVQDICGFAKSDRALEGDRVLPAPPPDAQRAHGLLLRGGSWMARPPFCNLMREAELSSRYAFVGFRVCRSWPG